MEHLLYIKFFCFPFSSLILNENNQLLLRRLSDDYDPEKRGIVKLVTSFLWGGRRGLDLETELTPLLDSKGICQTDWYY